MADKFYSYDPEDGLELHDTSGEAERASKYALDHAMDDGHWPENVADISYGRLVPLAECVQSNYEKADPSNPECEIAKRGWDYRCDYTLHPVPDELALLRAENAKLKEAWIKANARVVELERQERERDEYIESCLL